MCRFYQDKTYHLLLDGSGALPIPQVVPYAAPMQAQLGCLHASPVAWGHLLLLVRVMKRALTGYWPGLAGRALIRIDGVIPSQVAGPLARAKDGWHG